MRFDLRSLQLLSLYLFFSSQKLKRSLIVHICKLGVLYQVFGNVLVTGISPKNKSFVLTFQYPKFGIEIITDLPILKSSFNTFLDCKKLEAFGLKPHSQMTG